VARPGERAYNPASDHGLIQYRNKETHMAATTGRAKTNLHLRKEPNTKAESFDVIRVGQKVQILKNEGEWMLVRVDGNEGYLISKFVAEVKE
jgi:uncharacterized protein YgiM (DUF1202 family)